MISLRSLGLAVAVWCVLCLVLVAGEALNPSTHQELVTAASTELPSAPTLFDDDVEADAPDDPEQLQAQALIERAATARHQIRHRRFELRTKTEEQKKELEEEKKRVEEAKLEKKKKKERKLRVAQIIKEQETETKSHVSLEPGDMHELTNKAIECGFGLTKIKDKQLLRLVFLLNSKMMLESQTFGDLFHAKALQALTWNKDNVVPSHQVTILNKIPKTLLRLLYQMVDVVAARVLDSTYRDKVRNLFKGEHKTGENKKGNDYMTAQQIITLMSQSHPQALDLQKAYINLLSHIADLYEMLTAKDNAKEGVLVIRGQRVERSDNSALKERIEQIRTGFATLGEKVMAGKSGNIGGQLVNCKSLGLVLDAANGRMDENDEKNAFAASVVTTIAKTVNFLVTNAVSTGASISPAGPAGGALAGAAAGLVMGSIEKAITNTLNYNNQIKKLRRSIRRALISTFKGLLAGHVEFEERNQKRAAVLKKIREVIDENKKNKKPSNWNEIKMKVKMLPEEDVEEVDCAPVVTDIVDKVLAMLYSDDDEKLVDLVETCTPEDKESVDGKLRNKANPSSYERLLPTLELIAEQAGFKTDGVNAVEPPSVQEFFNDFLKDGGEVWQKGIEFRQAQIDNAESDKDKQDTQQFRDEMRKNTAPKPSTGN